MSDAWKRDDPNLEGHESLLRSIRNLPGYLIHRDSITHRPYATKVALRIDADGMSVHLTRLLESEHSVTRDSYYPDDYLIEFTPNIVRALEDPWGVVLEADPADPLYGKAHALVRHTKNRPSKTERERLREAINRECTWLRPPPENQSPTE